MARRRVQREPGRLYVAAYLFYKVAVVTVMNDCVFSLISFLFCFVFFLFCFVFFNSTIRIHLIDFYPLPI